MKRHFDELGRIVIPKEMREALDLGPFDYAEIELINNKIVISNPENNDKQKQFEFLMERENKLQRIEYILKNIKSVEIEDIKRILED